jgi:hypothetical protein
MAHIAEVLGVGASAVARSRALAKVDAENRVDHAR